MFNPALWTVAPLPFSLVQLSPLTPLPVWISIQYEGGYEVLGLRQINHLPKSPFTGQFFTWWHFALPSMSLIFLRLSVALPSVPATWYPRRSQCHKFLMITGAGVCLFWFSVYWSRERGNGPLLSCCYRVYSSLQHHARNILYNNVLGITQQKMLCHSIFKTADNTVLINDSLMRYDYSWLQHQVITF